MRRVILCTEIRLIFFFHEKKKYVPSAKAQMRSSVVHVNSGMDR